MINELNAIGYCSEDISLIENYDKAINDKTQTWHCHHRRETIFSKKDLIEIGEYYNRPACELIFLTKADHRSLHRKGKPHSEETKKKISESHKGKHLSEESKKKIGEARKGEKHPLFGKPSWNKGKTNIYSEETRKKMSEAKKGRNYSEETRKKIRESMKLYWERKRKNKL